MGKEESAKIDPIRIRFAHLDFPYKIRGSKSILRISSI